jgi:hypothetical protein
MEQGCQIFRDTIYQKVGKYMYQFDTKLPNSHKMYQMAVKYSKWPKHLPTFSFPRPFKIYPKKDFGLKKTSGNPGMEQSCPEETKFLLAAVALIPNSFWINRLHLFCFSLHN